MDRLSRAALSLASVASAQGAVIVYEPSARSDEKLFAEAIQLAHIVKYSDQRLATAGGTMQAESATLLEVQTLGTDGLRYRHRLGAGISEWAHLSAINAPNLVDSCGSGDWCTAGLLTKVAAHGQVGLRDVTGGSIQQALRYGQALAAWNCGFEGARGGMYAVDDLTFAKQIVSLLEGRPKLSVVTAKAMSDASVACPACPTEENGTDGPGANGVRRSTRKVAAA
jgi:fructokinase